MLLVGWRNQLKTIKTKRLKLKKERQEGEHKKKTMQRTKQQKQNISIEPILSPDAEYKLFHTHSCIHQTLLAPS